MWNKPAGAGPRPEAAPPRPAPAPVPERSAPGSNVGVRPAPAPTRSVATVGTSIKIQGEIFSAEELFVDGEIEGKLELEHRLTVGPNGKVSANVRAKEVDVHGSIRGNVDATDKVTIRSGARIMGDVKTAGIIIEDGAYFKGGIDIARPEFNNNKMPAAPQAAPPARQAGKTTA